VAGRIRGEGISDVVSAEDAVPPEPDPSASDSWRDSRLLFALSLGTLIVSRLYRLADFPIYFFCDEAIQQVRAWELLRDGMRDQFHQLLPTYVLNGPVFNLSTSVYAQVLPVLVFGKSVFLTRAVSALIACSASIAVCLILRNVFRARFWWTGVLLLGTIPAWFLHSRTAFETSMAVSFYSWALYFYLRYRQGRPRFLFAALVFGALAFYSYSPMQAVVPATAVLLLLFDLPFHWKNWRHVLAGLAIVVLLALPYARFRLSHPEATVDHLHVQHSYWLDPGMTLPAKLARYGRNYALGLSPRYWFSRASPWDIERHRMKDYGNLFLPTIPFLALGLGLCLRNLRSGVHRTVVLASLAAPSGAAIVGIGITRVLVFVIPVALVTALGLDAVASWTARRLPERPIAFVLLLALATAQIAMLRDATLHGPTWYRDYGLSGMQYGARQVFGEVRDLLARNPRSTVNISPDWANGADNLARFFLGDEPRVHLQNLEWFRLEKREIDADHVTVLPETEYQAALRDPRLVVAPAGPVLAFPDGTPGFHFVRLTYPPDIDLLMERERSARHALVSDTVALGGEPVQVLHSRLDMGPLANLFDGDVGTLVRTERVNPAVLEVRFSRPREVGAVIATTSSMDLRMTVRLFRTGRTESDVKEQVFEKLPDNPTVRLAIVPRLRDVERIRVEILVLHGTDIDNVHVRELRFE
jgi:4-amino-4-deoxy-L-arabinose transferase-like glycosyltransferase